MRMNEMDHRNCFQGSCFFGDLLVVGHKVISDSMLFNGVDLPQGAMVLLLKSEGFL